MKTKNELMEESINRQIQELNNELSNKENFKINKSQENATFVTLIEGDDRNEQNIMESQRNQ